MSMYPTTKWKYQYTIGGGAITGLTAALIYHFGDDSFGERTWKGYLKYGLLGAIPGAGFGYMIALGKEEGLNQKILKEALERLLEMEQYNG